MNNSRKIALVICIWPGINSYLKRPKLITRFILFDCNTHSERFWSHTIQNASVKKNTPITRQTALMPSTFSESNDPLATSSNDCPAFFFPKLNRAYIDINKKLFLLTPAGGTLTYIFRPEKKMMVAKAIKVPGMPKATLGPKFLYAHGISAKDTIEPALILK